MSTAWIVVVALAGSAALLALLLAALVRRGARRSDGPAARLHHAFAEARWRARGVWLDFADWLRPQR